MTDFAAALLRWSETTERPMPWRGLRDPYRIWLSEVILQQTRVEQGWNYYERFLAAFPTVHQLAAASEEEVLALWKGLGYYRRAHNLRKAARAVADNGGRFPDSFEKLLELPGVGAYTAAAIASFAYQEPVAVVDGNVLRVISRYSGIELPVDKPPGRKLIEAEAARLLAVDRPDAYNQAIMDFGALVCTPRRPACASCPVQEGCTAYQEGLVDVLPLKTTKTSRRLRHFTYLHLFDGQGAVVLRKRKEDDIWAGLWEMPMVEAKDFLSLPGLLDALPALQSEPVSVGTYVLPRHLLTHQEILARVYKARFAGEPPSLPSGWQWVQPQDLVDFGMPRLLDRYLTSRS